MKKTKPTTAVTAAYTGDIPHKPLAFLWHITKPEKIWMVLAVLAVVVATVMDQLGYYFLKLIVDATNENNLKLAMYFGMIYPAWMFTNHLIWRISGVFGMLWVTKSKKISYLQLVPYVMQHSHSYFSDRFAGSILSKFNNLTSANERLIIDFLWTHLTTVLSLLVTIVIISTIDPVSALLFAGLIISVIILNIKLAPEKRRRSRDAAETSTVLRGYIVDAYSNVAAVRQFARQPLEARMLGKKVEADRYYHQRTWIYTEKVLFINSIILFVFAMLIFYSLISRWSGGEITVGDFVLVLSLVAALSGNLIFIGRAFNDTARGIGESQEALEDLLLQHEILDARNAKKLTTDNGKIDWQNVTFEFGQNRVFDDFNLRIEPGQRVGLVGPSGAGKTTFVSLLLRQHDIQSGAIEIDGQNIAAVTQDSLREAIAVVPQEPLLFHRTIRENIAYGKPDATDEEIIEVAKKAQAHDFIASLPEGYDTLVGERGVKLSGGQKQRVAIARAMLKDAPILVLDEATSALDSESEVEIQKALHILMEGKTVVAIAHRLSTLREMDRIIVLENGQIVEDGSHESLKTAGGTYQRLWEHQAGGFLPEVGT